MTTSWSSHYRGTRLQRAQRPSVGLEQSALEAYTENYFKINAYPGSSDGSVRGVTSIAINKSHWNPVVVV